MCQKNVKTYADRVPERLPGRVPEYMPDILSELIQEILPDKCQMNMPRRTPELRPDRMPEHVPERISESTAERRSENMPDSMQKYVQDSPNACQIECHTIVQCICKIYTVLVLLKQYSCRLSADYNAMVGITRTKVFCSSPENIPDSQTHFADAQDEKENIM